MGLTNVCWGALDSKKLEPPLRCGGFDVDSLPPFTLLQKMLKVWKLSDGCDVLSLIQDGALQQATGERQPVDLRSSISFYTEIRQMVRASESASMDGVIEQEHSHIRRLSALRQDIENRSHTGNGR